MITNTFRIIASSRSVLAAPAVNRMARWAYLDWTFHPKEAGMLVFSTEDESLFNRMRDACVLNNVIFVAIYPSEYLSSEFREDWGRVEG